MNQTRAIEEIDDSNRKSSREFRGEKRGGVNRAYANPVEALQASGTCRTLLILNTCFLVLAGSAPTRGEWSLYAILPSLSLSLYPPPIFLFVAISLSNCETGLLCISSLTSQCSTFKRPTIGFREALHFARALHPRYGHIVGPRYGLYHV